MANDDSEPGLDRGMLAKAELEISDRIEERVWKRQKFILGVFVAGLTGFGVLGAKYGITYVGNEAEKHVTAQIERDTDHLRDRLTSELAEISLERAQLKTKLDEAAKSVDQLSTEASKMKMSTADLQRLATQYTRSVSQVNSQSQSLQQLEAQFKVIEKRVTGISHTVDASVAVAQTTQQTLGVLMAEHPNFTVTASPAASSVTLLPLIREISPVSGTHEVIISGVNLGTKAGHVYVSPTGSEEGYRLEAPVLSWSDTKVK